MKNPESSTENHENANFIEDPQNIKDVTENRENASDENTEDPQNIANVTYNVTITSSG